VGIIERGAEEIGIVLPLAAGALFESYYKLLEERGRSLNLTSIKGVEDTARLHFLDSVAMLKAYNFICARVVDIGSGAGFPGLPLKIAEPSIDLTMVEATGKRVDFLSEVCAALKIDAKCVNTRAEELSHNQNMREHYDIAVSRAVSRLNVLCELCLPFVRVGGVFIAMKGRDSDIEIAEAKNSIDVLGAEFINLYEYTIPETEIIRKAVVIQKTAPTPSKYPRRFAKIQSAPL